MSMRRSAASAPAPADRDAFAADVARGLARTPRRIPPKYFYDELGSALFEAICRLPWYGITRTEIALLAARAPEILRLAAPVSDLVELGPGYGGKLKTLVRSAGSRFDGRVHLVDVSGSALDAAVRALGDRPDLVVRTYEAEYEAGLATALGVRAAAAPGRFAPRGRALVCFLGSNVGNFDPPESAGFLAHLRASLAPGDGLLLGTDLVKAERVLRLAYDDPLGVTAAFNRNLLARINGELGGDFDLDGFAHEVRWDAAATRIEMHLVSRRAQTVHVPAAGVTTTFAAGESIWTESSCKYTPAGVRTMLARAGFDTTAQWIDAGFALTLGRAIAGAAPEPTR